jgi:hypothetical protein
MEYICKKEFDIFKVGKSYDLINHDKYFTIFSYYYSKLKINFDEYFETKVETRKRRLNELD